MIQLLKNLKIFWISVLFSALLSSCSINNNSVEWIIIGKIHDTSSIKLGFRQPKGNIRYVNAKIAKKREISVRPDETLCFIDHEASFNVTINDDKNTETFEIYVYPKRNVLEFDDYYLVDGSDNVDFYFIEFYDKERGKNYYIFSDDNRIEKQSYINEAIESYDTVLDNMISDCAYYTTNEQEMNFPYNGYIVKSKSSDRYVFLSTFWAEYTFD